MEGNPEDPADFNHPNMTQARMHHASKIDWFLRKIGQGETPSFFEQVVNGKINPFENLTQGHNPKGAGQFDSINQQQDSSKPKLSGDTKIEL